MTRSIQFYKFLSLLEEFSFKIELMSNTYALIHLLFISIVGIFLLSGCQTSPITEFSRINLGQDKSDVIEFAGGPSWKDRRNGMDRWTYILFQDGIRLERQVLFSEGIVAYVGDPIEPFISAEEQDLINTEKNKALDRMERPATSPSKNPIGRSNASYNILDDTSPSKNTSDLNSQ